MIIIIMIIIVIIIYIYTIYIYIYIHTICLMWSCVGSCCNLWVLENWGKPMAKSVSQVRTSIWNTWSSPFQVKNLPLYLNTYENLVMPLRYLRNPAVASNYKKSLCTPQVEIFATNYSLGTYSHGRYSILYMYIQYLPIIGLHKHLTFRHHTKIPPMKSPIGIQW